MSLVYAQESIRGLDGFVFNKIDATKNARVHSNMGNIYFAENNYISALKEYQIAFNLVPNSQASAVYLYNIAQCFVKLNDYNSALKAIKGAIEKDSINITYYDFLAQCCIKLGIYETEIQKLINDTKNPYNRVVVGLIYLKTNQKNNAIIIFDEFINQYPKMIITNDIKMIMNKINKN